MKGRITVPTLAIGARYDAMEPSQMERIAKGVKRFTMTERFTSGESSTLFKT